MQGECIDLPLHSVPVADLPTTANEQDIYDRESGFTHERLRYFLNRTSDTTFLRLTMQLYRVRSSWHAKNTPSTIRYVILLNKY